MTTRVYTFIFASNYRNQHLQAWRELQKAQVLHEIVTAIEDTILIWLGYKPSDIGINTDIQVLTTEY